MKYTFLIILFFFSKSVYPQLGISHAEIDFKEKQADSLDIKMDSIMILGVGSSVTRLFLEDLSNNLKQELKDQNITTSYFYLGKTIEDAKLEFSKLNKGGYKTLLFFLPESAGSFEIETFSTNDGGPQTSSTSMTYYQSFVFQLFKTDTEKKIWAASVSVECDPSKKRGSDKVAMKILRQFEKHKYIP